MNISVKATVAKFVSCLLQLKLYQNKKKSKTLLPGDCPVGSIGIWPGNTGNIGIGIPGILHLPVYTFF